jgi:hypothetical protein
MGTVGDLSEGVNESGKDHDVKAADEYQRGNEEGAGTLGEPEEVQHGEDDQQGETDRDVGRVQTREG